MTARRPKFPDYDRRRDGNPFDWIIRAAAIVRERRLRERMAAAAQAPERFRPVRDVDD